MISQPMGGKTDEEIYEVKIKATEHLTAEGHLVVDTYFNDYEFSDESLANKGVVNIPVYFLGESIKQMSKCDAVYFCEGWEDARGCIVEHGVAKAYGLKIMYEGVTCEDDKELTSEIKK